MQGGSLVDGVLSNRLLNDRYRRARHDLRYLWHRFKRSEMKTYDLLMLVLLAVWWLRYREKYEKKAVILYYVCGVFCADVFCGLLILVTYKRYPGILSVPALLMPIGGMAGLVYAGRKGLLTKSAPSTSLDTDKISAPKV